MSLEPIQQVAILIAASVVVCLMALRLRPQRSTNSFSGNWLRFTHEGGLGVLTGGFVALAALAVARLFPEFIASEPTFHDGLPGSITLVCALLTLALLCSERDRWTGHAPATLLAALVPWLLIPEWGQADGVRLPAEQLGLVSAALYRVVFSGARSERLTARARNAAVEATGDGVVVVDSSGALVDANAKGREAFGEISSVSANEDGDDRPGVPRLPDRVRPFLARAEAQHFTLRNSTGRMFEIWLGSADSKIEGNASRALIVRDVSARHRGERHLHRLAHYDSLTGLANRRLFIEQLEGALRDAPNRNARIALLYIDLDRFKEVNDTLGHGAGDELLRVLAKRFQEQLRAVYPPRLQGPKAASVARLGGDEFAVIIPEPENLNEVEKFAMRLLKSIGKPVLLNDREIAGSGSIGIALYPGDGRDAETLVKHADSALYGAKRLGRNRFQRYQPEFSREADRIRAIEQQLRGAIARNEFHMHYQPKIDIATDRVAGFEALLRWTSAELGHVGPDEFIPIAEERGLIAQIGAWCLEEACKQLRAWHDAGLEPAPIAVNVSSAQFIGSNLQDLIKQLLSANRIEPALLEIELTERLLLEDNEQTARALTDIKEIGVPLALDDFGTGFSALTYLNRFPLSVVKMDRGLLVDLETSESANGIAAAVISMCHSLGLKVVAEGVESLGQLEILREMNCDLIQGFLYSPALDKNDAAQFLAPRGKSRPVLTPKADAIPSVYQQHETVELELTDDDWETSSIESPSAGEPIPRALLFDNTGSLKGIEARLSHLGVEALGVSVGDLRATVSRPGMDQVNLLILASDCNLISAGKLVRALAERPDSGAPSILVMGDAPSEEQRKRIRELGARWVLWTPFDDADLRFLVRASMPDQQAGPAREDVRIPMDAMAWIRARARHDVGVLSSLSRRGAFVEMTEPVEVNSSLRLEFEIPGGRISTFAKVAYRRCGRNGEQDICGNGIGVTFYGLDPASRYAIAELVESRAAKYRP